jgi:hypothetical protein
LTTFLATLALVGATVRGIYTTGRYDNLQFEPPDRKTEEFIAPPRLHQNVSKIISHLNFPFSTNIFDIASRAIAIRRRNINAIVTAYMVRGTTNRNQIIPQLP